MNTKDNYAGLDFFRIPAALLVVAIHTSPLASWSAEADFFLTRVLARVAVPFFFMVTGQFVAAACIEQGQSSVRIVRYLRKMLILYGASILLYLPVGIYAGHYKNLTLWSVLRMLLFDGTFYHLWYFPACILGLLLVWGVSRFLHVKGTLLVSGILYLIGLFGDSYYGLTERLPAAATLYEKGFNLWSYTRNGLFMAPVFLMLGVIVGRGKRCRRAYSFIGFLCFFLLMTVEAFTLRHFGLQRHDSMYVMLIPVMIFLYSFLCRSMGVYPMLRTVAAGIYILHPAMIVVVRGIAKVSRISVLIENSFLHYSYVAMLSVAAAFIVAICLQFLQQRRRQPFRKDRTWIEIDRAALQKNVEFFRKRLPENCRLMPAIKANAYGHGAVLIAKELSRMGVDSFCVACVQEGIELRRAGIGGEILVLGYTHPSRFAELRRYHLSQTVIDYSYAEQLNAYGKKLTVHIAIDTGMHRLGERCENVEEICRIFTMRHLVVQGVFTHLSADDRKDGREKKFTEQQASGFYAVLEEMKKRGIPCPPNHLQSSYGVLNYPELAGDYARVGIALYGVLSTKEDTLAWKDRLFPVLSLKTKVVLVKEIHPGETAGYGFSFVSDRNIKAAVLAIGYADGFPRALSNGQGAVLIRGVKAPVIGTVCMDQTIVDVSGIPDVQPGDTAVVIGKSGGIEITASDLAEQAGTITNEILSRIGARPERNICCS